MTIDERVAHLQEAAMEEARAKANAIVKQHEQTLTNVLNQHKARLTVSQMCGSRQKQSVPDSSRIWLYLRHSWN